jgi:hypothetical protein
MASINNTTNNAFSTFNYTKISKLEDSKQDSYFMRKNSNSSYFIPAKVAKEIQNVPFTLPSITQSLKSQLEELQKLQSEISYVEEKIRELETSKRVKMNKVNNILIF